MAGSTTIRELITLILVVGADLSLFYTSGCELAHGVLGHLARLWFFAALRGFLLTVLTLLSLAEVKTVLVRFIAAHSMLPAVFETGSKVLYHEETQCGFQADMRCWLMCAGASLAAALFWEITIPDTADEAAGKEAKQKSRELFLRVLLLYKPYYHMLSGGFVFLFLAVICK